MVMSFGAQSTDSDSLVRPSGLALPLFLTRNRRKEVEHTSTGSEPGKESIGPAPTAHPSLSLHQVSPEDSDAVYTAQELQDQLWYTSVAMVDIQKQLHRGEESYYEDTHHGGVFRGWDTFIDARDVGLPVGNSAASSSVEGLGRSGARKIPAEYRWFSGSCSSIDKTEKPRPPPAELAMDTGADSGLHMTTPSSSVPSALVRGDSVQASENSNKSDAGAVDTQQNDASAVTIGGRKNSGKDTTTKDFSSMEVDSNPDKSKSGTPMGKEIEDSSKEIAENGNAPPELLTSATTGTTSTRRTTRKRKAGEN